MIAKPMKVQGVDISAEIVQAVMDELKSKKVFSASFAEKAFERRGVPNPVSKPASMRAADSLIQKLRKAGLIELDRKSKEPWKWVG